MSLLLKPSSAIPKGVNPDRESLIDFPQSQWAMWFLLPVVVISCVPPLDHLTRPGGYFSTLMDATYGPRDAQLIMLMTILSALNTYLFTAAGSNMGQTLGNHLGYRLKTPRLMKATLTGLPHRMVAAHENIVETFPGFAMALCLVSVFCPTSQQLIDGLVLHFFFKHILYYPIYLLDLNIRILVHGLSFSALLVVFWGLYATV